MSERMMIAIGADVLDEIISRLRSIEETISGREAAKAPTTRDPGKLLTAAEARDLVRCKRQRITEALASGALPHETRPGRGKGVVHMIKPEDALQWAKSLSRRN